jgi:hypothetical protein
VKLGDCTFHIAMRTVRLPDARFKLI